MEYIQPSLNSKKFTCPHCHTLSMHIWKSDSFNEDLYLLQNGQTETLSTIDYSRCVSCGNKTLWIDKQFVYPNIAAPEANKDMPEEVLKLYNEAGEIFTKSPRAACALLRLAIDKLCNELGEKNNSIDKNIAALVEKGLPSKVQKALDVVRVVGNKAVHPGEIAIDVDDIETVNKLFILINMVVDNMITQPNEVESLFDSLPESTKETIEKRDH